MIVSHEHRFIFMKTLKTAGTSVEIALSRVCGPDDVITPLPGADEKLRAERGGRPPQNYESPPLSDKVHEHIRAARAKEILGDEVWHSYYRFAIERNPWDAVLSLYYWVNRHDHALTFEEFLQRPNVETLARRNFGAYHVAGEIAVDRVLRFETLTEELAEVWAHLGLPGTPDLPRAKAGVRPSDARYRDFYDDASAELVRGHFGRTIADFGYTF